MPWKETSVMDERMRFVGRLLTGEKMAPCAGNLEFPELPATRSGTGISKTEPKEYIIAVEPLISTPISSPSKWNSSLFGLRRKSPTGEPQRSGNSSQGNIPT